jgi:hypothetical protein
VKKQTCQQSNKSTDQRTGECTAKERFHDESCYDDGAASTSDRCLDRIANAATPSIAVWGVTEGVVGVRARHRRRAQPETNDARRRVVGCAPPCLGSLIVHVDGTVAGCDYSRVQSLR